jgi:RNA polymerase sigma-70 factor, ECF subfamily
MRRVRDRDQAEKITAEVFHHAQAHLGRFEWRGVPFPAWLVRIAANAIHDRWKAAARESELSEDGLVDSRFDHVLERRAMLAKLVDNPPDEQRLVVIRRFVDQRSIREIAKELQRSEGAIKQLQFRALQSLKERVRSNHA